MIPPKRFDIFPSCVGCSEGLDAFRFFFLDTPTSAKCVCVFFPFILDIKFVGRTSRGHTGGRYRQYFKSRECVFLCLISDNYYSVEKILGNTILFLLEIYQHHSGRRTKYEEHLEISLKFSDKCGQGVEFLF